MPRLRDGVCAPVVFSDYASAKWLGREDSNLCFELTLDQPIRAKESSLPSEPNGEPGAIHRAEWEVRPHGSAGVVEEGASPSCRNNGAPSHSRRIATSETRSAFDASGWGERIRTSNLGLSAVAFRVGGRA